MGEIDIQELEKALASTKRKGGPGKKKEEEKLPKTKQALLDEAKRLNEEMDALGYRQLSSRYNGETWSYSRYGSLRRGRGGEAELDEIPEQALKRMVRNGRKRLQKFHNQINSLIEKNPTEALKGNLEGKTGIDIIHFIYFKKQDQLSKVLDSLVSVLSESTRLWLKFKLDDFIEATYYAGVRGEGTISTQGIDARPHSPKEAERTINFLNNFDQVIERVKSQVSQIKIKEVIK